MKTKLDVVGKQECKASLETVVPDSLWERLEEAEKSSSISIRPPNSFNSREYAERTGLSIRRAQERLGRLVTVGKLKRIRFKQQESTGVWAMRWGYQWVGGSEG